MKMNMSKMVAVKGHAGYFFDENFNIWSVVRGKPRQLKASPRWKNGGPRNKHLRVYVNGKNRDLHRLIFETFKGPIPEGMIVRHLDDDALNNHPSNLEVGTVQDNSDDCTRNGTRHTTLTYDEVREILILDAHFRHAEIARFYGVAQSTVYDIVNNRTWKHVSRENLGFGQNTIQKEVI
jgi:hypothetical protein